MLPETTYAYLAGLMDGDGTVSAWKNTRGYYQLSVSITMTHEPTILWLQDVFGGNVHLEANGTMRRKQAWRWQCTSTAIRDFLPRIVPYMITKKEAATLMLELLELRTRGYSSARHNIPQQDQIVERLRVLNKRGPG